MLLDLFYRDPESHYRGPLDLDVLRASAPACKTSYHAVNGVGLRGGGTGEP